MKPMLHKLLTLISLVSSNAFAGGWVSGGGNLLFDDGNPWFIQNTETIRYCVEIDESHFGPPVSTVRLKIEEAFGYWYKQFETAARTKIPSTQPEVFYEVRVGTQRVEEVACEASPDIRFQFGVLSPQQARFIRDPNRIVGTAIRTDYDTQKLRGRGFIYIAPADGPLAMRHPKLVSDVWSTNDAHRLKLVLIHELGHVFGLQHTNSGSGLMDHDFPDMVVTSKELPPMLVLPAAFHHHRKFFAMRAGFAERVWNTHKALGLPEGWDTVQVKFDTIDGKVSIDFWGGTKVTSSLKHLGTAFFEHKLEKLIPAISLYLRPEQEVFPQGVATERQLTVVNSQVMTYTGKYHIGDERRGIFMEATPDTIHIGAEDAERNLYPLVFYAHSWRDYVMP